METYAPCVTPRFIEALEHTGPVEILAILAMLALLLLASSRTFSPSWNTIIALLPISLGAGRSLQIMFHLIPPSTPYSRAKDILTSIRSFSQLWAIFACC